MCMYRAPQNQALSYGPPPSGESYRYFSSRLDADFGETVWLMMEIENINERERHIVAGLSPIVRILVTTHECVVIWHSPFRGHSAGLEFDVRFMPGEMMKFGDEWSFTDNWGEMVSPGGYLPHVSLEVVEYNPPGSGLRSERARHTVFERIGVTEEQLKAARPAYPPTPVDPSACGGNSPGEAYARWVMDKHSEMLEEWRHWSAAVLSTSLLDESRQPTGARGIRVVVEEWRVKEAEEVEEAVMGWELLPECLEDVPVQLVVRLGD